MANFCQKSRFSWIAKTVSNVWQFHNLYEIVEGILYRILSIEIFPGSGGSALCTFRTCNLVLTWLIYGSGARSAGVRDRPGRAYRTLCDSHISADSIEICIDSHIELIPPHSFRGGSWSVCAFKTCHLNSISHFVGIGISMIQKSECFNRVYCRKGARGYRAKYWSGWRRVSETPVGFWVNLLIIRNPLLQTPRLTGILPILHFILIIVGSLYYSYNKSKSSRRILQY